MIINRLQVVAGVLLTAFLSGNASAQSDIYIFGAVGNTNSDIQLGGLNNIDDGDSSYSLGAGYAFTPNFSVELAYQDFGSHDAATDCPPGFTCLVIPVSTQADLTGIALNLVGSIPLTESLDAYGRVGMVSWDIEFDGISAAFDKSGEDIGYGVGLSWSIGDHWSVFGEYSRLDLDLDSTDIGVSYHF